MWREAQLPALRIAVAGLVSMRRDIFHSFLCMCIYVSRTFSQVHLEERYCNWSGGMSAFAGSAIPLLRPLPWASASLRQ